MRVPTELERALLSVLEGCPDGASWRRVASALSALEVPRSPDMLSALKELQSERFLERQELAGGQDCWKLTPDGRARLSELRPTLRKNLVWSAPNPETTQRVELKVA